MKNAQLTQYPAWRIWPVHIVAKLFGVLVKVDAMPYGSVRIHRRNFPPSGKSGSAVINTPNGPVEVIKQLQGSGVFDVPAAYRKSVKKNGHG